MTEKRYKVTIFALVMIIGVGGLFTYNSTKELERLKQENNKTFFHILWRIENTVEDMDDHLAQAITTTDSKRQREELLDAWARASFMNDTNSVFYNFIPFDNNYPGGSVYNALWSQSTRYLDYLNKKNERLNPIEKKNITLIRDHLAMILSAYGKFKEMGEKDSWVIDIESERAKEIVKVMIDEIHTLPNVGEDDQSYQEYFQQFTSD